MLLVVTVTTIQLITGTRLMTHSSAGEIQSNGGNEHVDDLESSHHQASVQPRPSKLTSMTFDH